MAILKMFFFWVLFSSLAASIMALLLLLVKLIFKNRINARVYGILWLLVVVRLVTAPFAPESQVSMFNLLNTQGITVNEQEAQPYTLPFLYLEAWNSMNGDHSLSLSSSPDDSGQTSPEISGTIDTAESANHGAALTNVDLASVLTLIWLTGLLLISCVLIGSGIAFSRELQEAVGVPDFLIPQAIKDNKQKLGIRGRTEVYSSSRIASPCVNGIIKPKVYIPQQMLLLADQHQLTHVLMHEFAHLKRKDHLINILLAAVNVLHWFNPVLWYAMRQLNLNREITCDIYALELLGQEESIPYGMTLIHFSRQMPQGRFRYNLLSFYKSKKQIERRIVMIKKYKKGSYRVSIATMAICLIVGAPTLTNAAGTTFDPGTVAAMIQNGTGQLINEDAVNSRNDKIRNLLGNKEYMYFNSLEKALNFAGFKFKVPDYVPKGFELYNAMLYQKKVDSSNLLIINYWSTTDGGKMVSSNEEHHFALSVSKGDLLQRAKSAKNSTYEEKKMKLAGLDAVSLSIHTKSESKIYNRKSDTYSSIIVMNTVKQLIWQDQGIWYNLEYYVSDEGPDGKATVYENMSFDELGKIAASLKDPKEVKNLDFTTKIFENSFAIYDERDLKDAEKVLGFTPKFPLSITGGYQISSAGLSDVIYFKTDQATPNLGIEYRAANKGNIKDDSQKIEFDQSTLSSLYDGIAKNGHMSVWIADIQKDDKVISKTAKIAGVNVFVLDDAEDTNYVWEQNGIYYHAAISKGINNKEEIMKAFLTETPNSLSR